MVARQRAAPRTTLPTGTVTFLFSDIEGSTRLVSRLGAAFGPILERHQELLRQAFEAAGGIEIATEGDSFFVVFERPSEALQGAVDAQVALAAEPWPEGVDAVHVRMGLHSGEGRLGGDNYVGIDVHRAARIAAAAHGGEVLLSAATQALAGEALPSRARLRDLGSFRLKDLDSPERLVQLVIDGLPSEFPAPRTLETPSNLPIQLTSFVGRGQDVAEVVALLDDARLVTLTGPGGTGKTRLSLEVASRLTTRYPDGTFFVELAPITDPELVPTTIAQAVGLRESPAEPVETSLARHLRDLRILLVLDNLEQLIGAGPLIGRLLQAAPHLTVLASSREALRIRGEQEYPVPPLRLPDAAFLPAAGALSGFEAIALFVERARAVNPGFRVTDENAAAVVAICVALDGLPLAIELAAARSKLFAPAAILARLGGRLSFLTTGARDLTERQRSLRGAIDWSHDLLEPTEQALFRRLAVFVGGCTIDSASVVCDPDGTIGIDVVDGLSSFVDKSLIRRVGSEEGEPRFRMLETIREYAIEKLAADADDDSTRRHHEDYFLALARRAEPELLGTGQRQWLDRLELERDNLRAALRSAQDGGRIDAALDTAGALWRYWQQRGHLAEGRDTLSWLLDRPDAAAPTASRARALSGLGSVLYWQAQIPAAERAYGEALDIARTRDDPAALAEALYNAGFVAALLGAPDRARANYSEAMAIFDRLSRPADVVRVREALVFVMYHQGEFAEARELQTESLKAFRTAGEPYRIANGLSLLAAISTRDGGFDDARSELAEAVTLFRAADDVHSMVRVTINAAVLASAERDHDRAARLMGAAETMKAPLGEVATPMQLLRVADPSIAAREALGERAFEAAFDSGREMTLDEVVAYLQA